MPKLGTKAGLDITIAVAAVMLVWAMASTFDLFELLFESVHRHESWELDDLVMAVFLISLAFIWFSYRRGKEKIALSEQILEQQHFLARAQQVALMGNWELDRGAKYLQWSDQVFDIFEIEKTQFGASYDAFLAAIHPQDRDVVTKVYEASVADHTFYHVIHRLLMADGRIKYISVHGDTDYDSQGNPLRSYGTAQDITRQRKIEHELQRSRFALDSSPDAFFLYDPRVGRFVDVNNTACQQLGYTRGELLEMNPLSFALVEPDALERIFQQLQTGEIEVGRSVCRYRRKDGSEFPVEALVRRFEMEGELFFVAIARDVSSRLKSEALMRQLSTAIQQSVESVMVTDVHSVIEYVNPAFTRITGYSYDDVIGKSPAVLNSGAQSPDFYKQLWGTILSGEIWHGSLTDKRQNGEYYPAMMSITPIKDEQDNITHFVSLQQDMSDYSKLERQFLQAQKMEAMGTLVGGIAHDFNNVIAAIQGNAYLARIKLDEGSKAFEKVKNIEKLGTQAGDMVRQLLTFARKDNVDMKVFNINSFMKEAYKLTQAAIPENIEYQSHICADNLMVNGDATQLQQLLMNLLNNARDAVESVAEPLICCKLELFSADSCFRKKYSDLKAEQFAHISVSDNGHGIAQYRLDKVFEPFFTTKGAGKGTGLGLAMVYGVVEAHQGIIEVDSEVGSEVGSGTTMHIYLPVMQKQAVKELIGQSEISKGHGQLLLLVDDDENIRQATGEVLKALGYKVMVASDGGEALDCYNKHRQDIDLIISDIIMPRVGGIELLRQIREADEHVRVIFITGYDNNALQGNEDIKETVLSKPFSIQALSESIHAKLMAD